MCARNHHGGLPNPLLKEKNLDLDFYKSIMPAEFIQQLTGITMCGNFGDPILNSQLIDIVKYTVSINQNINIDIHTNGSARTKQWWRELATALPKAHMVHFGIDGLADTHSLYRIDTDWNKIIENAKEFISAGGRARWNFITFKHNEHQLEQCRQLAKEIGFNSFHEKQTSRFIGDPWFEVYDKQGNPIYKLESPSSQKIEFIRKEVIENYKEHIQEATVKCAVQETKSIYIDALGYLWPCCFVAGVPYLYSQPSQLMWQFKNDYRENLNKVLELFGGIEGLNLAHHTMESIVETPAWQTGWSNTWEDNSLIVCVRACGKWKKPVISQCQDQFLELSEFSDD
jgi:hypothetical protein